MFRKSKCKNCLEIKKEKGKFKCYGCKISGCNDCIQLVCCDCGEIMCKKCIDDDECKCGCYGNCSLCGNNVDRGNNGWPCNKCKKWYCSNCISKSKCKECSIL